MLINTLSRKAMQEACYFVVPKVQTQSLLLSPQWTHVVKLWQ